MITQALIETFGVPNSYGRIRKAIILQNEFGRYTWQINYPEMPNALNDETWTHYDTPKAARRAVRNHIRNLAQ